MGSSTISSNVTGEIKFPGDTTCRAGTPTQKATPHNTIMSAVKVKRFLKSQFLKQIGRELLDQFFRQESDALGERQLLPPASHLGEKEYYEAVTQIIKSPNGLTPRLVEAAYAIADMAEEDGEDRLESAVGIDGFKFEFEENLTRAGKAMKAWLTNEVLFRQTHRETRASRVVAMDYFTCKPTEQKTDFQSPENATITAMNAEIEAEFCRRGRGSRTTRVEYHQHEGEHWFSLRHGETLARVLTVEDGEDGVAQFRPVGELLAVYNTERNTLRIYASRKWQLDLVRRVIGQHCFANPDYFSDRMQLTLSPLQTDQQDALDTGDIPELSRVVLKSAKWWFRGQYNDCDVKTSEDMFASARQRGKEAIPRDAVLEIATFDFYFAGEEKPREVRIKLPNKLKLARYCDATVVNRFITLRGYCATANSSNELREEYVTVLEAA